MRPVAPPITYLPPLSDLFILAITVFFPALRALSRILLRVLRVLLHALLRVLLRVIGALFAKLLSLGRHVIGPPVDQSKPRLVDRGRHAHDRLGRVARLRQPPWRRAVAIWMKRHLHRPEHQRLRRQRAKVTNLNVVKTAWSDHGDAALHNREPTFSLLGTLDYVTDRMFYVLVCTECNRPICSAPGCGMNEKHAHSHTRPHGLTVAR
eukprot:6174847-Pleurochrysis_carterae.AAC.3